MLLVHSYDRKLYIRYQNYYDTGNWILVRHNCMLHIDWHVNCIIRNNSSFCLIPHSSNPATLFGKSHHSALSHILQTSTHFSVTAMLFHIEPHKEESAHIFYQFLGFTLPDWSPSSLVQRDHRKERGFPTMQVKVRVAPSIIVVRLLILMATHSLARWRWRRRDSSVQPSSLRSSPLLLR